MSKLKLANELVLPLDACTQTFAWIGRKGSGKTYGSGKFAEELLESCIQVVILDTVGNWFGIRIAQDGKAKGYEIPVFGGLRQDLPLLATAGDVVADVVIDSRRSIILDVSQFNFSDRKRFSADFGARLWQRKKGEADPAPLHLIIEECQLIVPQFVGKDETRMVHVYEEIIRLGRNYGIGVSMLTQRPQSVNKEVLTQAECIMAFQLNGVPERKAMKEWLTHEGGDVNLVDELPSLQVGTCYLWSPQWLRLFKKITVAKKRTFDASATPKAGQHVVRRDPSPLDVKDIEARMSATIEKARADDPKVLRGELAKLKAELAKKPAPVESVKEVPVLDDQHLKSLQKLVQDGAETLRGYTAFLDEIKTLLSKVVHHPRYDVARRVQTPTPQPTRAVKSAYSREEFERDQFGNQNKIGAGERRILTVLAQYPAGKATLPLAHLAGYTVNGHFNNMLGFLRSQGLITKGQPVQLTEAGRTVLGPFEPLPTGEALRQYWLNKLGTGEARILGILIICYPEGLDTAALARESGYTVNGHFNNMLGHLRSIGLAEGRGLVRASSTLFE